MPTRREIIARIETPLTALYGEREARQIARIVVMELGGLCLTDLVAEPDKELGIDELDRIIGELAAGRPLQYVLGHTEFYGLDFQVREGVLIPRPETEELVRWIAESPAPDNPAVLDVGTGSGCIGLAVAKHAENCRVVLGDLSEDALRICRQNARQNGLATRTTILTVDALQPPTHFLGDFNVIVCNPPYIRSGDIPGLDVSVRDYEPLLALDGGADGLAFYRYLAQHWKLALRRQGTLLFEVGYDQAEDVSDLLAQYGYRNITQHKDYNGILRGVEATL